jgi:hypothetical protein
MTEDRLVRAHRRLARPQMERAAVARLSEADLFEAYGMTLAQALSVLNREPRRRCPCAAHGGAR